MSSSPAEWTVCHDNLGRTYYYNSVNGTSSWTKPDALKTDEDRALDDCVWKETFDANGRPYYYNTSTLATTWVMPPEVLQIKHRFNPEKYPLTSTISLKVDPAVRPARPLGLSAVEAILATHKKPSEYASITEAAAAFNKMLEDHGVGSCWTLRQVIRSCARDERWSAVEKFSVKKSAISSWQKRRAVEEEQHASQVEKVQVQYLKQILQGLVNSGVLSSSFLSHQSLKFSASEVSAKIQDAIFSFIDPSIIPSLSVSRQHQIIMDFCDRLVRSSRKDEYRIKREKEDAVFAILRDNSTVQHNCSWNYCSEIVIRLARQHRLTAESLINVWKRVIDWYSRSEMKYRQSRFETEFNEARLLRQRFRELLDRAAVHGLLHLGLRYADFVSNPEVQSSQEFQQMKRAHYGSPAADLYRDYLHRLEDQAVINATKLEKLGVVRPEHYKKGCGDFGLFRVSVVEAMELHRLSLAPHEITFVFEYVNRKALSENPDEVTVPLQQYILEEGEEVEDPLPLFKKPRLE
ncbi:hypothetical protein RCL1_002727 [Eukaryota sp. TZLM3-RCL]